MSDSGSTVHHPSAARRTGWIRLAYAALLLLIGVSLVIGGGVLIAAGGSPYYLIAGLLVIASGVLIGRGDRRGVWLYAAMLVGTFAWALWVGAGWLVEFHGRLFSSSFVIAVVPEKALGQPT